MWKLLIADDERTIREGIKSSIDWTSLEVSEIETASDGKEAYECIIKSSPDIAIVDIVMPEMSGIDLIAKAKSLGNCPEFIILSGFGEFELAQEAIRYDVSSYLLKPCSKEEIEIAVKKAAAKLKEQILTQKENSKLHEDITSLIPAAKEQSLRNILHRGNDEDVSLFLKLFIPKSDLFQILVIKADDNVRANRIAESVLTTCNIWYHSSDFKDYTLVIFGISNPNDGAALTEEICEYCKANDLTKTRYLLSKIGYSNEIPLLFESIQDVLSNLTLLNENEIFFTSDIKYSQAVRSLISYARKNLSKPDLNLNYIANEVVFMNPDYLGKLFKKECNSKFSDYIIYLRIEHAIKLLVSSPDLKVYQIAEKAGFGTNFAYFSQVFKKQTGMLPSEYRIKHSKTY